MARGRKSSLRIVLSPEERQTLERWQRSTTMTAGRARRGKIILLLAMGYSQSHVAQAAGVQRAVVRKWAKRVLAQRLDGLVDAPGRGAKGGFPPEVAIHVVRLACERPDVLGRSLSQWDCVELAHQLIAEGIVEDISSGCTPSTPGTPPFIRPSPSSSTSTRAHSVMTRWCSPWMRKPLCSLVRAYPPRGPLNLGTCRIGTSTNTSAAGP